jgi:hypothetical protein
LQEFTPVFAKHSRSFSLIDSLAIGVDRMQRSFGSMQKKGRKGEPERRELTVVTRRGGELPVGRPIGNYSIREHKRGSQYRSGENFLQADFRPALKCEIKCRIHSAVTQAKAAIEIASLSIGKH